MTVGTGSVYPTSLDTDATLGSYVAGEVIPSAGVNILRDAHKNVQGKVGIHNSGVKTTLDYFQRKFPNMFYGASATGTDAYAITIDASWLTAYYAGLTIWLKADVGNTGACSLNVTPSGGAALGAKSIKLTNGNDPGNGDIAANSVVMLVYDGTNFQLQEKAVHAFVRNAIGGLITSRASISTITVGVGACRDDGNAYNMTLAAALTKSLASAWAVGNNNGGLDTGAEAASTLYAVWLIARSDTGVVDALLSTSFTAPTMPTSYDEKRLIGAFWNDGSSNIRNFVQTGSHFRYLDLPVGDEDISDATIVNNTWETGTIRVPPSGLAIVGLACEGASSTVMAVHVRTPGSNEDVTDSWSASLQLQAAAGQTIVKLTSVTKVNASRQVDYRGYASGGPTAVRVGTKEFIMFTREEP